MSKPLNNSQPPETFLNPPENFTHTLNISQPPQYFLTPPLPEKNLNPSEKPQPLPKNFNPSRKNGKPSRKNVNPASRIIPNPTRKNLNPSPK